MSDRPEQTEEWPGVTAHIQTASVKAEVPFRRAPDFRQRPRKRKTLRLAGLSSTATGIRTATLDRVERLLGLIEQVALPLGTAMDSTAAEQTFPQLSPSASGRGPSVSGGAGGFESAEWGLGWGRPKLLLSRERRSGRLRSLRESTRPARMNWCPLE
jgi:hypothetical protein